MCVCVQTHAPLSECVCVCVGVYVCVYTHTMVRVSVSVSVCAVRDGYFPDFFLRPGRQWRGDWKF